MEFDFNLACPSAEASPLWLVVEWAGGEAVGVAASWISLTRVAKAWAMAGIWALMPLTKTLVFLDSIMSLFEGSLIIRPSTKYYRTIAEIAPSASFFKQKMWTKRSIRRSML